SGRVIGAAAYKRLHVPELQLSRLVDGQSYGIILREAKVLGGLAGVDNSAVFGKVLLRVDRLVLAISQRRGDVDKVDLLSASNGKHVNVLQSLASSRFEDPV